MVTLELTARDGNQIWWRMDKINGYIVGPDHISLYVNEDNHIFHLAVSNENTKALEQWRHWLFAR